MAHERALQKSRTLTLSAAVLTIAAATWLYVAKFETRRIEGQVQALERAIEKADSDIIVLRAERAYLGRPDRLDTLARGQGLGPIRSDQYRRPGPRPTRLPQAGDGALHREAAPSDGDAEALAAARTILGIEPGHGSQPQ